MTYYNIGIWGDSITWGAFDYTGGGWAHRLKLKFLENLKNEWKEICCLGINGDTTDGLLQRFEVEAQNRRTNLAIFAIGINDSCYFGTKNNNLVQIDKFENNLKTLKEKANKLGINKIFFLGLNKVNERYTVPLPISSKGKSYTNDLIIKYDEIIRKFCKENNLVYIDIMDVVTMKDLDDGLHPNDAGHKKIYNIVYEYLQNLD